MQLPLQITFKGMDPSPAVEARIREEAEKLDRLHGRLMRCHVVVEAPHRHQHKGKIFRVALDITVPPRKEIVVGQERRQDHAHEDVYVVIRDAFEAAARRLEDHARRGRGQVKAHEGQSRGRVARLFPDYGFIEGADGQEIYFHRNSVVEAGFDALEVGREVRYVAAENESAEGWQASTVHPMGKHHPVP